MGATTSQITNGCLLNRLFGRRSKKTSMPRVIGLCVGNSPVTGEFPTQRASNAEKVSVWWRHHAVSEKIQLLNNHSVLLNVIIVVAYVLRS